jgi:hypothetical protein
MSRFEPDGARVTLDFIPRRPSAAAELAEAGRLHLLQREGVLARRDFPEPHRANVHPSTHGNKRAPMSSEILPNETSIIRPIGAVLREQNDYRQCYVQVDAMCRVRQTAVSTAPVHRAPPRCRGQAPKRHSIVPKASSSMAAIAVAVQSTMPSIGGR